MSIVWIAAALFGGLLIGATYQVDRRAEREMPEFIRRWRDRVHPALSVIQGGKGE